VDLARDLTISGFFLSKNNLSLFYEEIHADPGPQGHACPGEGFAFSLGYFTCAGAESSTINP
jgi:hypothetical protein